MVAQTLLRRRGRVDFQVITALLLCCCVAEGVRIRKWSSWSDCSSSPRAFHRRVTSKRQGRRIASPCCSRVGQFILETTSFWRGPAGYLGVFLGPVFFVLRCISRPQPPQPQPGAEKSLQRAQLTR